MNEIKRHVPSFVDVDKAYKRKSFETREELLNIEWVKKWTDKSEGFYRFSLAGKDLMAEFDKGKIWHVVGTIKYQRGLGFPKWNPREIVL